MTNVEKYKKYFKNFDPRFLFVNVGYNLRSTDLNAAIGLVQLKKLKKFNKRRNEIGYTWNEAFKDLKKDALILPMEITKIQTPHGLGFHSLQK